MIEYKLLALSTFAVVAILFIDAKVNRFFRMTSVFSADSVKSSFPFWQEYLAESVPQLPIVYRHRQPSESIVKSKVPNGKEQKAPNQEGKS